MSKGMTDAEMLEQECQHFQMLLTGMEPDGKRRRHTDDPYTRLQEMFRMAERADKVGYRHRKMAARAIILMSTGVTAGLLAALVEMPVHSDHSMREITDLAVRRRFIEPPKRNGGDLQRLLINFMKQYPGVLLRDERTKRFSLAKEAQIS